MLAKLLFVSTLTDSHLGIFESIDIQIAALKLANKTRRSFLRYVFHEVGVTSFAMSYYVTTSYFTLCYVLSYYIRDVMSYYIRDVMSYLKESPLEIVILTSIYE